MKSSEEVLAAVEAHRDYIAGQTLASRFTTGPTNDDSAEAFEHTADVEGRPVTVRLHREI